MIPILYLYIRISIVFVSLSFFVAMKANADNFAEDNIRAKLIHSIIQYVKWPNSKANRGNPQVVVCLSNYDRLVKSLEASNQQRSYPFELKIVPNINYSQLPSCHILVIAKENKPHLSSYLEKVSQTPVLTISDIEDFAVNGGMIEIRWLQQINSKSKLSLEVNVENLENSYLDVDSRLLQLVRTIRN